MSIVKVKIASIEKIETVPGKFGPQKKISIKEACEGGDRYMSGFVNEKQFRDEEWKPGKVLELEVWEKEHNGKNYWNFKFAGKDQKKQEEVLEALRQVYKKLNELDAKVTRLLGEKPPLRAVDGDKQAGGSAF